MATLVAACRSETAVLVQPPTLREPKNLYGRQSLCTLRRAERIAGAAR
jgi:hypothetical protein